MRNWLLLLVAAFVLGSCGPKNDPTVAPPAIPVSESPRKMVEQAEQDIEVAKRDATEAIPVANKIVEKGTTANSKEAVLVRDKLIQSTSSLEKALASLAVAKDRSDALVKERDQYLKQWQSASKDAQKERERNAVLAAEKAKAIKQRNTLFIVLCVIVGGAVLFFVLKASGRAYRLPFL
jgi:hypothetical protein